MTQTIDLSRIASCMQRLLTDYVSPPIQDTKINVTVNNGRVEICVSAPDTRENQSEPSPTYKILFNNLFRAFSDAIRSAKPFPDGYMIHAQQASERTAGQDRLSLSFPVQNENTSQGDDLARLIVAAGKKYQKLPEPKILSP